MPCLDISFPHPKLTTKLVAELILKGSPDGVIHVKCLHFKIHQQDSATLLHLLQILDYP